MTELIADRFTFSGSSIGKFSIHDNATDSKVELDITYREVAIRLLEASCTKVEVHLNKKENSTTFPVAETDERSPSLLEQKDEQPLGLEIFNFEEEDALISENTLKDNRFMEAENLFKSPQNSASSNTAQPSEIDDLFSSSELVKTDKVEVQPSSPKKRGRPKGSKNKPKIHIDQSQPIQTTSARKENKQPKIISAEEAAIAASGLDFDYKLTEEVYKAIVNRFAQKEPTAPTVQDGKAYIEKVGKVLEISIQRNVLIQTIYKATASQKELRDIEKAKYPFDQYWLLDERKYARVDTKYFALAEYSQDKDSVVFDTGPLKKKPGRRPATVTNIIDEATTAATMRAKKEHSPSEPVKRKRGRPRKVVADS